MTLMYINRQAAIYNLAGGNTAARDILAEFTTHELWVLAKHPDLKDRLLSIADMDVEEAWKILQSEYGLSTAFESSDGAWISIESLAERVPEALRNPHCGWYVADRADLLKLAHQLLAQEVRINLQIRYLLHKKIKAAAPEHDIYAGGLYL